MDTVESWGFAVGAEGLLGAFVGDEGAGAEPFATALQ